MKKKFLSSKDLFRDIRSREIYKIDFYDNLSLAEKADVDDLVGNTSGDMSDKLRDSIGSLGIEISKYKDNRNRWKIPIEEEELFIRAFNEFASPVGKKLRGKKKKELNINDIQKEIKSMKELIDKTYSDDDVKDVIGYLEYTTNFRILEKISEIKEPINQIILQNMENILNWEEHKHRLLSVGDAVYLIDYYKDLIERTTRMWNSIVDIFSEIRESENEVIDFINDDIEFQYEESETVLTEAIKIYNKKLRSSKSEDNQSDKSSRRNKEYTDEEIKAVREVLETHLKESK